MEWIQPMEPILQSKIASGDEWIHQIKWDGIRGISYIEDGKLSLFTKRGRERTPYYPELHTINELLNVDQAILDGEIIVLNDKGKPSFEQVLIRERINKQSNLNYYTNNYPVKYIVFDILALDGEDLRRRTLAERKNILKNNLKQNQTIAITDDFKDGEKLISLMKKKGWEGIVSKKIDSYYFPGKHHHVWLKTKINKKMLTVVCGLQWKNGFPNSLLLGVFQNNKLYYIGKASIGLKQSDFKLLKEHGSQLEQKDSPFTDNLKIKDVTWLKPVLTCWVQFLEWTKDKQLRHPQIIGFSSEKPEEADGKEVIV